MSYCQIRVVSSKEGCPLKIEEDCTCQVSWGTSIRGFHVVSLAGINVCGVIGHQYPLVEAFVIFSTDDTVWDCMSQSGL